MNFCEIIKNEYKQREYKGIIVCGPTCSGKSNVAMSLCEELNGELVSADSMQIYRYMDIGTAKPTSEEQKRVLHHMIDIVNPWVNYNAFTYKEEATLKISDIIMRGKVPIVCGGTGLYINSLIDNRNYTKTEEQDAFSKINSGISSKIEELFANDDRDMLYSWLCDVDKNAADTLHKNNVKRVKRCLELYYITGKTRDVRDRESVRDEIVNEYLTICLWPNREELYSKIDRSVDIMREMGLFSECEKVYTLCRGKFSGEEINGGILLSMTSLAAIGYKELLPLLGFAETEKMLLEKETNYSLDDAFNDIKLNTRHYAKRQMTWFKKTPGTFFLSEDGLCTTIK